jgi:hypothetical protein
LDSNVLAPSTLDSVNVVGNTVCYYRNCYPERLFSPL